MYQLTRTQILPVSLDQAWDFFSTPKNLEGITPDDLKFEILTDLENEKAYAGQIINYKVSPFKGIKLGWTTEISQCVDRAYFVDEQRFGPYAFWHHKHFFKAVGDHVEMKDVVDYALPFGILGRIAHWLFVKKKLEHIFDFRYKVIEAHFAQS